VYPDHLAGAAGRISPTFNLQLSTLPRPEHARMRAIPGRPYLPPRTFNLQPANAQPATLQLATCNLQPFRKLQPIRSILALRVHCSTDDTIQTGDKKPWRASLSGTTSSSLPTATLLLNPRSFAAFATKHTKKCNTPKCRWAGSKASF